VEPLSVVIHTELHLRPDLEKYVKPRVELECISDNVSVSFRTCQVYLEELQWRNYERRSEAIASGRQAAGGAFGRRIVCFTLQNSAERS